MRQLYKLINHIINNQFKNNYIKYDDKSSIYNYIYETVSMQLDNCDKSMVYNILDKYMDIHIHIKHKPHIELISEETIIIPDNYKNIVNQFNYLSNIPQPVQKSKEWFDMRNEMITASSIATCLNENPYETIYNLLKEKCRGKEYKDSKATHHGKKYEHIATMFYSHVNNVQVDEFGLIQSIKYPFIGASPDGICSYKTLDNKFSNMVGRMLEIKCPLSRTINTEGTIDGDICPHYYWCQVQIQLEVCELNECDFLQCQIEEYNDRQKWLNELNENTEHYIDNNNTKINVNNNFTRGCIIQLLPKKDINEFCLYKAKYIYPPTLNMSVFQYDEWILNTISNLYQYDKELYNNYVFDRILYWKLQKTHSITIQKDTNWFNEKLPSITKFWNDVLYYRQHDDLLDDYIKLSKEEKRKNRKKNNIELDDEDIGDLFIDSPKTSPKISKKTSPIKKQPTFRQIMKKIKDEDLFLSDE